MPNRTGHAAPGHHLHGGCDKGGNPLVYNLFGLARQSTNLHHSHLHPPLGWPGCFRSKTLPMRMPVTDWVTTGYCNVPGLQPLVHHSRDPVHIPRRTVHQSGLTVLPVVLQNRPDVLQSIRGPGNHTGLFLSTRVLGQYLYVGCQGH